MALSTIPVSSETKKKLQSMKGNKTWDELLNDLVDIAQSKKRVEYKKRLQELLEMEFEDVKVKKWAREY
jgi:predicted CopG family antitoxin